MTFEQGLDGSSGVDAGRGPAGEGQLAVVCARRDDNDTAAQGAGASLDSGMDGEPGAGALDVPDEVTGPVAELPVSAETFAQPLEAAPAVVERAVVAVTVAPVLSPGARSSIDQDGAAPLRRSGHGG